MTRNWSIRLDVSIKCHKTTDENFAFYSFDPSLNDYLSRTGDIQARSLSVYYYLPIHHLLKQLG